MGIEDFLTESEMDASEGLLLPPPDVETAPIPVLEDDSAPAPKPVVNQEAEAPLNLDSVEQPGGELAFGADGALNLDSVEQEGGGVAFNGDGSLNLDSLEPTPVKWANHPESKGAKKYLAASNKKNITAKDAMATLYEAQKDEYNSNDEGWFMKTLYTMNLPQQAATRAAIAGLEDMGGEMTPERARELLSRRDLSPHDVLEVYWREPEKGAKRKVKLPNGKIAEIDDEMPVYERAARFVTGFALDVLLDPLNLIGLGPAAKGLKVAGKTFNNLNRVSKAERAIVRGAKGVEKILTTSGELKNASKIAGVKNTDLLQQLASKQITFRDFTKVADVSEDTLNTAKQTWAADLTEKSFADELLSGDRVINVGARIPFTNIGMEVSLPTFLSKTLLGRPAQAVSSVLNLGVKGLTKFEGGQAIVSTMRNLTTNTGFTNFDDQIRKWYGRQDLMERDLMDFEKVARDRIKTIEKNMSKEQYDQFIKDMIDDIEYRPLEFDEAYELYEKIKKTSPEIEKKISMQDFFQSSEPVLDDMGRQVEFSVMDFDTRFKKVIEPRPQDLERAQRLERFPQIKEVLDGIRSNNKMMIAEYEKRGIPFQQFNPFGEGWANQYLKHLVSSDWIKAQKEMTKNGSVVEELGKVLNRTGKVDTSSLHRAYRGGINEANKISLDSHGVKIFVDDPLEVASKRMMEMSRVKENWDLFDNAIDYAVVGGEPGYGWRKFDINDFGHLVLDGATAKEGGDIIKKIESFIPEFYTKSGQIHLPENVYDRLMFMTKGHNTEGATAKFMNSMNWWMKIWRNTALFGPGYQGQNFFTNLTQMASNTRTDEMIQNTAQAMYLLTHDSDSFAGKGAHLFEDLIGDGKIKLKDLDNNSYQLGIDDFMREATEDGVLSTFGKTEMSFDQLASDVASNREARKTLGHKVETLADYVYLWKLNRWAAHQGDAIPRLATYLQYRKGGFTRDYAREAVERNFFSYNVVSRTQDRVRNAIPFSTFAMKTIESKINNLKDGRLKDFLVPYRVQRVFEGEYVQDHDSRQAMRKAQPFYFQQIEHKIHGPIMPGMQSVFAELPFSTNILPKVFNTDLDNHPLFQTLALVSTIQQDDLELKDESWNAIKKSMGDYVEMMIPSWGREILAIAEINGAVPDTLRDAYGGEFFSRKYSQTIPTPADDLTLQGKVGLDGSRNAILYENSAKFGEAFDKVLGGDTLAKLTLPELFEEAPKFIDELSENPVETTAKALYQSTFGLEGEFKSENTRLSQRDDPLAKDTLVKRGNYIKKKFRDLTLGLARIDRLDKNFLSNLSAIKRQINSRENAFKQDLMKQRIMFDPKKALSLEVLQKSTNKTAKEIVALRREQETLLDYYNYILGASQKDPHLFDDLFSPTELDYEEVGHPDSDINNLYPKPEKVDDDSSFIESHDLILKNQIIPN